MEISVEQQNKLALESYVAKAKERNLSNEQIRKALHDAGWSEDDISKTL